MVSCFCFVCLFVFVVFLQEVNERMELSKTDHSETEFHNNPEIQIELKSQVSQSFR